MKMIYLLSTMILLITSILVVVLNLVSKKTMFDREKNSPFECGFDPKNFARLPFSLQFFLIAVIFVIFDVELTLLMPTILIMKTCNMMNMSLTLSIFIFILIIGIMHEQNQGALNWVK